MSRNGRPVIVFGEEQIATIKEFAGVLNQDQLCDVLGVTDNTLRKIFERQPEVFEAYRKTRALTTAEIAGSLVRNAKAGDFNSQRLYLTTQAGWTATERQEHSGPGGGPIENKWTVEVVEKQDVTPPEQR